MKILHVGPVSSSKVSGLSKSIPLLAQSEARMGATVTLLNSSDEAAPHLESVRVLEWSASARHLSGYDLVVFHSTFILRHAAFARMLRSRGTPYAIMPHGGLTLGALSVKRLKKQIGRATIFRGFFKNAAGLCFLSQSEAANSETFGLPWITSGNVCTIPPLPPHSPRSRDQIRLLFVGRLDPHHKGLDLLLEAAGRCANALRAARAQLILAGPAPQKALRLLSKLVEKERITDLVNFTGAVARADLPQLYSNADLFLHPSRFEGLPNAVLEAMSYGLPVLITPGTNPGQEVQRYEAGWVSPLTADDIAASLRHALAARDDLFTIGQRARKLVEDNFSWDIVAQRSLSGYRYLLDSLSQA